jgi:hypothetical protein
MTNLATRWTLVLGLLLIPPMAVAAQEEPAEPEAASEAADEECEEGEECPEEEEVELTPMEKIRLAASPGDYHELLEPLVGEWDLIYRVWTTADGAPLETRGSAVISWILDKRFIRMIYRGELLGRDFEGERVVGYDNQAAEFVSTWRDNLGTYTLVFEGKCDDVLCRKRTMTADITDPVSGQQLKNKGVFNMGRREIAGLAEEEDTPEPEEADAEGDEDEPVEAEDDDILYVWSEDDDAFTYESFLVTREGREFKNLEIVAEKR